MNDIHKKVLYLLDYKGETIRAISISEEQENEYKKIGWKLNFIKTAAII